MKKLFFTALFSLIATTCLYAGPYFGVLRTEWEHEGFKSPRVVGMQFTMSDTNGSWSTRPTDFADVKFNDVEHGITRAFLGSNTFRGDRDVPGVVQAAAQRTVTTQTLPRKYDVFSETFTINGSFTQLTTRHVEVVLPIEWKLDAWTTVRSVGSFTAERFFVPEPGTMTLLSLMGLTLISTRRR